MKTATQSSRRAEPHLGEDPPYVLKPNRLAQAVRLALAAGALAPMFPLAAQAAVLTCPPPVTTAVTVDTPSTIASGATCNIQSGGSVTIVQPSGALSNSGALNNNSGGALTNNGTLTNSYRLRNESGANLTNVGTLTNSFSLENYGTLKNKAAGTLTNNNVLINNVNLTNAGALINNFSLQNYGALSNQAGGMLTNSMIAVNGGKLTNAGTLTNQGGGTLVNQAGGTLTNNNQLRNDFGATLSNTGTLSNNDNLYNAGNLTNSYRLRNESGAHLTNTGTLTNTFSLENYGTLSNQAGGALTNNNVFINNANLTNAGTLTNNASLQNYGTLTNQAGGMLTNSSILVNGANLTNAGALTNQAGGTLVNQAGGTLTNSLILLNAGRLTNYGAFTITPSGTVSGSGRFTQYVGQTTVDGSLRQNSIAINDGRLAGTGTLASPNSIFVSSPATLAPGDNPGAIGTLTVNAPLNLYGTLAVDVNGLNSFDFLNVNGPVTFGPNSLFNFMLGNDGSQKAGNTFDFFNAGSFVNFGGVNFNISGLATGLNFSVTPLNGTALQLSLFKTIHIVPEPGELGLFGLGLVLVGGGLGWRATKRA